MAKKIICLFLSVIFCATLLIACADNGVKDQTINPVDSIGETENADPLAQRMATRDNLPAMDLDGLQWRVYGQEPHLKDYFYTKEEDGEVVNDAIFYANRAVEERFNLEMIVDYSGKNDNEQPQAIQRFVSAGDDAYSLVTCHDVLGTNLSLNGMFVNLHKINYIDFAQPWWHDMEAITIMGQAYMISSDMTMFQLGHAYVIYFNKDIMDDWNIPYPYQDVFDNKWTLDRLISITKDVYADVNGNSIKDKGDMYGFAVLPECYGWLDSFNIQTTVKDPDDILRVNDNVDKMSTLFSKTHEWLFKSMGAHSTQVGNYHPTKEFMDGEYMMVYGIIEFSVKQYRFVEKLNYGLVPMVKYDENQKDYITAFLDYPFFVLNVQTDKQLDITGLLVEALSSQGYRQIAPAYYEIALKVKYSQDDESVRTIEIINDTLTPSLSWCFENWQGLNRAFYDLNMGSNGDYASWAAKKMKSAEARVKQVLKALEKMDK